MSEERLEERKISSQKKGTNKHQEDARDTRGKGTSSKECKRKSLCQEDARDTRGKWNFISRMQHRMQETPEEKELHLKNARRKAYT